MKTEYRLKKGLIHYYYGDGRGKTSTTIGTIIRAIGQGLNPILIQFLKLHDVDATHSGYFMGEINFLKEIIPIKQFGSYKFVNYNHPSEEDLKLAMSGFNYAKEVISSGEYDLIVLDEIIDVIQMNLMNLNEFLKILEHKPDHVEIILTGHFSITELIKLSHYVTHYGCIHHPFYDGFEARRGIEY